MTGTCSTWSGGWARTGPCGGRWPTSTTCCRGRRPRTGSALADVIRGNDHVGHLTSIHNCFGFYDHARPWITHCSIQRTDVYRTAENTGEWREAAAGRHGCSAAAHRWLPHRARLARLSRPAVGLAAVGHQRQTARHPDLARRAGRRPGSAPVRRRPAAGPRPRPAAHRRCRAGTCRDQAAPPRPAGARPAGRARGPADSLRIAATVMTRHRHRAAAVSSLGLAASLPLLALTISACSAGPANATPPAAPPSAGGVSRLPGSRRRPRSGSSRRPLA